MEGYHSAIPDAILGSQVWLPLFFSCLSTSGWSLLVNQWLPFSPFVPPPICIPLIGQFDNWLSTPFQALNFTPLIFFNHQMMLDKRKQSSPVAFLKLPCTKTIKIVWFCYYSRYWANTADWANEATDTCCLAFLVVHGLMDR